MTRSNSPFFNGVLSSFTPAGFILTVTFFAYGALVKAAGLPLEFGLALTVLVFAAPGQIIMVDEIMRGASLIVIFLSVTISSVRLLPLTVSIIPILRDKQTPKSLQFLISHFIAVTSWVISMLKLPDIPKQDRAIFTLGLGIGLVSVSLIGTALGFFGAAILPQKLAAAALMVSPVYFFLALINTSKSITDKLAFLFGSVLAYPIFIYEPGFTLLGAGLIGGTLAYFLTRKKSKNNNEGAN